MRNVLSRPPDDEELRALSAFLAERTDRPDDACRQLVWVLLTDCRIPVQPLIVGQASA